MAAIDVSPRARGENARRLARAAAATATGIRIITRPSSARDCTAAPARHASKRVCGTPSFSIDHRSADPLRMSCRGEAMAERVLGVVKLGLLALALRAGAALAAPVNSDLATAQLGGGCYPTGIHPAVLDIMVLVDQEWATMMHGMSVVSDTLTLLRSCQS